jgi:PHAX RNA-binding domain-containing protein
MDHLTVAKLVQSLQESNTDLLTKVLRTLGQDRCRAILAETLTCEANGWYADQRWNAAPDPWGCLLPARQGASDQARTPGSLPPASARPGTAAENPSGPDLD